MRNFMFKARSYNTGSHIYGGYYEWENRCYIIQKEPWDTNPLMAHMIEVNPHTVEIVN